MITPAIPPLLSPIPAPSLPIFGAPTAPDDPLDRSIALLLWLCPLSLLMLELELDLDFFEKFDVPERSFELFSLLLPDPDPNVFYRTY